MQPYPRSLDLVWPGHLHGTGCLSARAMNSGFPIVVWCLCLGLGSVVTPPFLPESRVCVLRLGFRLCPTISGWVSCCVRLRLGSAVTSPLLAGV